MAMPFPQNVTNVVMAESNEKCGHLVFTKYGLGVSSGSDQTRLVIIIKLFTAQPGAGDKRC